MNKLIVMLAGVGAISASGAAQAQVQINYSTANPVPASNDFQSQLNTLGLTRFTAQGATMTLASNSTIFFEFLGSESGFSDTFTAGPVTYTENSSIENHFGAPIVLGSANFLAGSLAGLMTFTSSGGVTATIGADGFGIFLGPNQVSGQSFSTFYLGYDDQITNADDNHDDFIVRATVRPAVPEPATWAMMLVGFGAMGVSLRRRRRTSTLLQAA